MRMAGNGLSTLGNACLYRSALTNACLLLSNQKQRENLPNNFFAHVRNAVEVRARASQWTSEGTFLETAVTMKTSHAPHLTGPFASF